MPSTHQAFAEQATRLVDGEATLYWRCLAQKVSEINKRSMRSGIVNAWENASRGGRVTDLGGKLTIIYICHAA